MVSELSCIGTSLVSQWLRLCSQCRGMGLILDGGTKVLHDIAKKEKDRVKLDYRTCCWCPAPIEIGSQSTLQGQSEITGSTTTIWHKYLGILVLYILTPFAPITYLSWIHSCCLSSLSASK